MKSWSVSAVETLNTAQVEDAKAGSLLKEVGERWHIIDLNWDGESHESVKAKNNAISQSAVRSSSSTSKSGGALVE